MSEPDILNRLTLGLTRKKQIDQYFTIHLPLVLKSKVNWASPLFSVSLIINRTVSAIEKIICLIV